MHQQIIAAVAILLVGAALFRISRQKEAYTSARVPTSQWNYPGSPYEPTTWQRALNQPAVSSPSLTAQGQCYSKCAPNYPTPSCGIICNDPCGAYYFNTGKMSLANWDPNVCSTYTDN